MRGHKRERAPGVWKLIVNDTRDPYTGKRRNVYETFRGNEREADTALAQLVARVVERRHGPGADAPLADVIDAWLALVADDRSPTTIVNYRSIVRAHIAPTIGRRPIDQLTTAELDGFYRRLAETKAPATVRQVHSVIRTSLSQAVKWGWLTVNPATEATPPKLRRKPLRPPSKAEAVNLLRAADRTDPMLGCFLRVAAAVGARRGEVLALRWSRVDLETGGLLIDSSVARSEGRAVVVKDTKTHAARRVAIDTGTRVALVVQRDRQQALAVLFGCELVDDPFVFSSPRDPTGGVPVHPDSVSKAYRKLADVHAPGTRLHDLRHFVASQLMEAGESPVSVAARLGHKSAKMTLDVYGHSTPAADRRAADLLGGLLE